MLKRRQGTPPEAPAPSKRPNTRSRSPIPVGANGQPLEVIPGKGESVSKVPSVTKQKIGQPHPTVAAAVQAEQAVNNPDREAEARTPEASSAQIENISHGQLVAPEPTSSDVSTDTGSAPSATTPPPKPAPAPPAKAPKPSKQQAHVVPTHAGWFSWTSIHTLEKRGLPEFFNGKTKMNTPELYMEYRNFLIQKYRDNPETVLSIADIQDLVVGDLNAVRRIIEFLDHWGLINYHATTRPGQSHPAWLGSPSKVEENSAGELYAVPHSMTPLASLYQFDTPKASLQNPMDPVAALAETFISEAGALTPGPSVEYHCNACSADCSKRRYHCQKQADFDLCPDCYNDGKFGPGMASADFIRMDAHSDANSDDGGWTDQETLLLLEALELFGDNWNEIAEHVATKSKAQCILHFIKMPIEDSFLEEAEKSSSSVTAGPPKTSPEDGPATPKAKSSVVSKKAEEKEDTVLKAIMDASASVDGLSGPEGLIAFADAGNPVMAQVAFLAAMVGPRVAAVAAQSALMALSEDDPASQLAAKATFVLDDPSTIPLPPSLDRLNGPLKNEEQSRKDDSKSKDDADEAENGKDSKKTEDSSRQQSISAERVRNAAATALAAAAVKAKLLADQEEREMQRLVASVIENQLKKLETKLKNVSELEVMLKKEYEQIERARQRHFAERHRLLQSRMAATSGGLIPAGPGAEAPQPLPGPSQPQQQLQQQLQQQQSPLQNLQQQPQQQQQQQQQQQSLSSLAALTFNRPNPLLAQGSLASGSGSQRPALFSFGPSGVPAGMQAPPGVRPGPNPFPPVTNS